MIRRFLVLAFMFLFPQPLAAADWLRAESEHYVVHAKLNERQMRELVQAMEDFNLLLKSQLPAKTRAGRKLELYLEKDYDRITRVSAFRNIGFVGSWPEVSSSFVQYDPADDKLFRHYAVFYTLASHYTDNSFFRTSPLWFKTGAPLFFSTTYIDEEGAFILGAPDIRRPIQETVNGKKLARTFTTLAPAKSEKSWSRFYRLSREATYPLLVDPTYSGKLEGYLDAFSAGKPVDEAMEIFGDLDALGDSIQERLRSGNYSYRRVALKPRPPIALSIREMRDDEIALTEPRFRRLRAKDLEKTSKNLRKLTERFEESAPVWHEYAATEFARVRASDFGEEHVFRGFGFSNGEIVVTANPYSDAEAWRAVNRALEINPDYPQARRLKAEILLSRLVRTNDLDDAKPFEEIRAMLAPLAADAAKEPLAAALMFQSYIEQGIDPPTEVLDGLGRAFVANPAVEEFRYAYAVALARGGNKEVAERLLTSMLNNPDYRAAAERALAQ